MVIPCRNYYFAAASGTIVFTVIITAKVSSAGIDGCLAFWHTKLAMCAYHHLFWFAMAPSLGMIKRGCLAFAPPKEEVGKQDNE